MTHLNSTITRIAQGLKAPQPLPSVTREEAESWFSGWWAGLLVGAVAGAAIGALAARYAA